MYVLTGKRFHAVRDGSNIDIFTVGGKSGAKSKEISFYDEKDYDNIDPFTGSREIRPLETLTSKM